MHTSYLGSIDYYRKLLHGGGVVDLSLPYAKGRGMNRCLIDSPNGALGLSVPVCAVRGRVTSGEVMIAEHGNWRHQHWNALTSSYRQSPYFDYYEDDFRPFYSNRDWATLGEFNAALDAKVMELLGWGEGVMTCSENVRRWDEPYYQVFAHKHGFVSGLSIVDLLFNMGPEAVYWL